MHDTNDSLADLAAHRRDLLESPAGEIRTGGGEALVIPSDVAVAATPNGTMTAA